MYHDGARVLQDRFDTRRMADRLEAKTVHSSISDADRAFIEARDMFFLATADSEGRPTCSYKGGDPGFVRVVDERTIAFPNYDGNGMYLSMGNAMVNLHVGVLFIDWEDQQRLRINGEATLHHDDPLLANYPEAQFLVRVTVREVFPNCPRYIHKMTLVERSLFVPHEGTPTPVPDWKRASWMTEDALPRDDPARSMPTE